MASATAVLPPSAAPSTRIWNSLPPCPTSWTMSSRSSCRESALRMSLVGVGAANFT